MRTSVIIPTYNYGRYLPEAIDSVQRQTVDDLEIIVIDDGSTDDTADILGAIDDPRLTYCRTINRGISAARNEGLRRARAPFIAFLDADDRWRPEKLERQLAIMDRDSDIGAVFTNIVRFDSSGVYPRDQFTYFPELAHVPRIRTEAGGWRVLGNAFEQLVVFTEFPTYIQSVLFRASAIEGIRFPEWRPDEPGKRFDMSEDTYFCLRAYERAPVAYLETPLVEVRRHGSNITHDLAELPHARLAVLRLLDTEPHAPSARLALRRRLGRAWIDAGKSDLTRGRFRRAASSYLRALRYPSYRLSAVKAMVLFPFQVAARVANTRSRTKS
jgi:glycosyltransferase involved in cell wall biosynthesis